MVNPTAKNDETLSTEIHFWRFWTSVFQILTSGFQKLIFSSYFREYLENGKFYGQKW